MSAIGAAVMIAVNVIFVPKVGYWACAWGGFAGYGIGSGYSGASCGNITIQNTVTKVTAKKGADYDYANLHPHSIGKGGDTDSSSCGTVTIGGTEYPDGISDSPYVYEP